MVGRGFLIIMNKLVQERVSWVFKKRSQRARDRFLALEEIDHFDFTLTEICNLHFSFNPTLVLGLEQESGWDGYLTLRIQVKVNLDEKVDIDAFNAHSIQIQKVLIHLFEKGLEPH